MKIILNLLVCVFCLAVTSPSFALQEKSMENKSAATKKAAQFLNIGSDAPSLNISDWVSTGDFEKVTDFKPDKIYVVEFWATWCRPCIASMPHISKLQTKYADQGVQIISVTDEELEKVEAFAKRKVGKTDKTYGELTSNYCLTADPDKSTKKAYMTASGEITIPVAFIVGKTGKIEWIGRPIDIDEPLEQVVAGNWDRDAAKAKRAGAGLNIVSGEVTETMELIEKSIISNDMDKAIEQFDEAIAVNTGKDKDFLNMKKYQVMEKAGMKGSDVLFARLADEVTTADAKADLAWSVAKLKLIGANPTEPTIDRARVLIDEVVAEDDDAMLLDIQSRLAHLQGELDEALEIRLRSLKTCPPKATKNFMKSLNELKAEIAAAEKTDSDGEMEPKKDEAKAE